MFTGKPTQQFNIFHSPFLFLFFCCACLFSQLNELSAADWPMWGGNPSRSGVTEDALPEELHLNWVLNLRQPEPAWHSNQPRVQFDLGYEPVVSDGKLFIGSMVSDRMTAYDTKTGRELWRFYTEGPVRLAPVVQKDKVLFACDDGYLYCLNASDGNLIWKFFGGPFDKKVIGNDRLTSIYPARGAPVVYEETVYFASSVWPFMGIFIHALDVDTGELVWTNSGTGSMYIPQQHDRPAFAGVAPQGYLVATENWLMVAGGQTVPLMLERQTGKFSHVNLYSRQMGTKGGGGYSVRATDEYFVTNVDLFRNSDGKFLSKIGNPVITQNGFLGLDEDSVMHMHDQKMKIEKSIDRKGREVVNAELNERWNAQVYPLLERIHFKAGSRIYCSGKKGLVGALEEPSESGAYDVNWEAHVNGSVFSMIPGDDRLFVSTDTGSIYCFAENEPTGAGPLVINEVNSTPEKIEPSQEIKNLLEENKITRGYAIVLGTDNKSIPETLLTNERVNVVCLESDDKKVNKERRRLDEADIYGERVSLLTGDLFEIELPPYLAHILISENPVQAGFDNGSRFTEKIFYSLRPYGGVACLKLTEEQHSAFQKSVKEAGLQNAVIKRSENKQWSYLVREGALPGSDNWTHQYGNPGNTVVTKDQLVKAPMGLLWFGGLSNEKVLPRHGHGPNPQVAGGRLFIEGRNMLRSVDVYNGTLVWEREFLDIGKNYDYTSHEPGAGAIGSNYASLDDSVYLIQGNTCFRLDPETGEMLGKFLIPPDPGTTENPNWGCLSVYDDVLIAGIQPVDFKTHAFNLREMRKYEKDFFDVIKKWKNFEMPEWKEGDWEPPVIVESLNKLMFEKNMLDKIPEEVRQKANAGDLEKKLEEYLKDGDEEREKDPVAIKLKRELLVKYYDLPRYNPPRVGTYAAWSKRASQKLMGFNRFTGEKLWEIPARYSFRHNAIASGNGMVFAIDRLEEAVLHSLQRRGVQEPAHSRIIALDVHTGEMIWSTERRIFGTFLNYSEEFDVVLQGGSAAGDRALDEAKKGMVAYLGKNGNELWENDLAYSGPLMMHHHTIYSQPNPGLALDLLTGEQLTRKHPLSGESVDWTYCRDGGCNTAIGSEHLFTFRSSAAGFYDLSGDSGTGNWGGFRSSCSSNLIPANGVLNAPDYTRTCTCAFQNRSSLALVHMPEIHTWTFNRYEWDSKRVKHTGLNIGAPGDRRSTTGLLWLDYPSVGGDSPDIPVEIEGDNIDYYRQHPSFIKKGEHNWVCSSGVEGASTIKVTLDKSDIVIEKPFTVRLYFAEPTHQKAGERVFDVLVQNQKVLEHFDPVSEAGSDRVEVVKEIRGMLIQGVLEIRLEPVQGKTLLSGIEIIAE